MAMNVHLQESVKVVKEFLGGNWKPLVDLIVSGDIKGVAGVVGCSNLTAGGHDDPYGRTYEELIARILSF